MKLTIIFPTRVAFIADTEHKFCEAVNDWGYNQFIKNSEAKSFVAEDTFTVSVRLQSGPKPR